MPGSVSSHGFNGCDLSGYRLCLPARCVHLQGPGTAVEKALSKYFLNTSKYQEPFCSVTQVYLFFLFFSPFIVLMCSTEKVKVNVWEKAGRRIKGLPCRPRPPAFPPPPPYTQVNQIEQPKQ